MCRGQQRAPHTRGHGKRRSIFTTVPAVSTRGVAVSACPALRAYSDATNHISFTTSPSIAPHFHTPSSVRLHRTMSLCGTHRVCVPECPPLGRPSYNKVGPYQNCQSMRQIRQIPVSPPDAAWIGDPRRSPRRPAVPKRGSDEAKGVERGWDFRIEKAGHAAFARACLPSLRRGVPVEAGMCTC